MSTKTTILCSRQKDLRGGRGRETDMESRWQQVFQKLLVRGGKKFPYKTYCWIKRNAAELKNQALGKDDTHVLYCKAKNRQNYVLFQKKNKN